MSAFIGKLEVELADEETNEWALIREFAYQSDLAKRTFFVPVGFRTNFASVPRLPIAFWLFGDTSRQAAVIHDYLYATKPVDRAKADAILREASAVSGVSAWRRWGMWVGVRIGGGTHW